MIRSGAVFSPITGALLPVATVLPACVEDATSRVAPWLSVLASYASVNLTSSPGACEGFGPTGDTKIELNSALFTSRNEHASREHL